MVKKEFSTKSGFLHFPIFASLPEEANYIKVAVSGEVKNIFAINIAKNRAQTTFYAPLDIKRYGTEKITLICDDEDATENLFDLVTEGGSVFEEKELYPDLYKEEIRQQVHFSPARGWMNDPNGLVFVNNEFNMYFQHNAFSNHSFGYPNIGWGLAKTKDGIHFKEYGDKILTDDINFSIASGSAIIDRNNIAGFGKNAILAYCSKLYCRQFKGRQNATSGGGQNLYYSLDGGMTFTPYEKNPVIPVPEKMEWRDPKILQLDEKTLGIAVYETFEDKNCISIYKSYDGKNWEFCSRNFDFYECPDLFKLKVKNSDEEVWALYGANGVCYIGTFDNFVFKPVGESCFVDYGICVYAGQTFNNFGDNEKRIYTAWLCDWEHDGWKFDENEPHRKFGFSQSMAIFTEFTIVKTESGYKLLRAPIEALKTLRGDKREVDLQNVKAAAPCEIAFTLKKGIDAKVRVDSVGFDYIGDEHKIISTTSRQGEIIYDGEIEVRIIVDKRTTEIYVANEMVLSFNGKKENVTVQTDYELKGEYYPLKSIWENI